MALRKEQVVLAATGVVLGWMLWSTRGESPVRGAGSQRADPPELPRHPAPDTALALAPARMGSAGSSAETDPRARDLFSPPSDTHPLPPLDLVPIPLAPLAMLAPPPEPGPAPSLYGRFLRTAPYTIDAPNLFATEPSGEAPDTAEESAPAEAPGATRTSDLTAEEKSARIAGYKKLYDWVRTVEFKFGQIRSPDRYRLSDRPTEEILFVEFNPATGLPRLAKQGPVPLARSNVAEFGFADTVQNQIEIRRAEFDDPLTASQYDGCLAFADWCVEQRLETPRALEVAEEMYRRAMPVFSEDPLPRLGLARCYEAGFEFEKAFQEYQALLAGAHARNPLVLARLAELEARFRLFDEAEARFLEAERYGRTQWQVQHALGRFYLDRGRPSEASLHLRLASQNEPSGAERKRERARIRVDLAAALLASGEIAEATEWFEKARQADPSEERAVGGTLSVAAITRKSTGSNGGGAPPVGSAGDAAPDAASPSGAGFDLQLANGIEALSRRDVTHAARAKQSLLSAAAADPLRAHLAWRALSFLAEISGSPEDALRYAEQAVENDPEDAWALYQRGRLLAQRDDLEGAMESFSRSLDVELDFPDALAAMGEIQNRRGEYAAAERYLERALALDPKLAGVAALRGLNFLGLGSVNDAERAFGAATALAADQPTARNGLAWCAYLRGDVDEAMTRLRELDDLRRALPETDPHRTWAREQLARIQDHLEKVSWRDRFERTDLRNGWEVDERAGPQVSIHDGVVTLGGVFKQDGRARLWQLRAASDFVSLEARLTVRSGTNSRAGIFVSRETARAGETQVESEVTLSRNQEPGANVIQTRVMKRGEEDLAYTDLVGFQWKLDTPVVLRIERTGESSDTRVRMLVDGFPVLDGVPVPNLGRTTSELRIGIFAQGQPGRAVQVDVDDVEIVFRDKK